MVVALVFALIIFFGAWAVSADVGSERSLAFGLPGTTPTVSGENVRADQEAYQVAKIGETTEDLGDTWWGQAFLKACPLH